MKKAIYVLSIVLTLIILNIVIINNISINKYNKFCNFCIKNEKIRYVMKYWKDESENKCYVFIPSFGNIERIEINSNCYVYINDQKYGNKDKLNNIHINKEYNFRYGEYKGKIIFLKANNVSTMFIETQSGNMERIHSDKDYKEKAKMSLINKYGKMEYNGNLNYIKGRGNSTWNRVKKPYNIQLSKESNLLNMGIGKNWTLIANMIDKTNIRNKTIYDFANQIGLEYSPNSEFVNLYLNGEYVGLYLLSEKTEIAENRVEINNGKQDITGPYLLEMDLKERYEQEKYGFITNRNNYFVIKDFSKIGEEQVNYIKKTWQNLEDAIYENDKNIEKYIDIKSWTKKYLIEEIFGNFDANKTSQFFYKKPDEYSELIYAGPVWDYDGALGIVEKYNNSQEYIVNIEGTMWQKLMENEKFYQSVIEEYNNVFLPQLSNLQNNYIDKLANKIYDSSQMDFIRWKNADINPETQKIYNEYEKYEENLKFFKMFLQERVEFLNREWKDI